MLPAFKNCHPPRGQADFLQQRFNGFGSFVRPQVTLEVAALVLGAGHNRHSVRAGLERLDQIRNIYFSGAGQADRPDGVATRIGGKAGKMLGRQMVGAVEDAGFQGLTVWMRGLSDVAGNRWRGSPTKGRDLLCADRKTVPGLAPILVFNSRIRRCEFYPSKAEVSITCFVMNIITV